MTFVQIRTVGNKEEGDQKQYYNYEFAIATQEAGASYTWLDFNGPCRYPQEAEEGDGDYEEDYDDRTHWGINNREIVVVYSDGGF